MAIICEKDGFIVEAVEHPHVDRAEGGHVKIYPKQRVLNRQQLTPKQAIQVMRLSVVVGKAMEEVMNARGVDIGRINYQDNGNWSVFKKEGPYFHIHLYGRAKSAKVNKYGDAIISCHRSEAPEHYASMKPLKDEDVVAMRTEIEKLLQEKEYSDAVWSLN